MKPGAVQLDKFTAFREEYIDNKPSKNVGVDASSLHTVRRRDECLIHLAAKSRRGLWKTFNASEAFGLHRLIKHHPVKRPARFAYRQTKRVVGWLVLVKAAHIYLQLFQLL